MWGWLPLHRRNIAPLKRKLGDVPESAQVPGFASSLSLKRLDHVDIKCSALPELVGHSAVQGWRSNMEDRFIISDLNSAKDHSLLAIFDGHSGVNAAQYCSQNLVNILQNTESWKKYTSYISKKGVIASESNNNAISKHDETIQSLLSKALVEAYICLDASFLESIVTNINNAIDAENKDLKEIGLGASPSALRDMIINNEPLSISELHALILNENADGMCIIYINPEYIYVIVLYVFLIL